MRTLTTITCLVALALATTALAACGGDDDGGGGDAINVVLDPIGDASQFGTATLTPNGEQTEVIFEPSAPELLGYLLRHYLNIYLYFVLLNAKASEQSARMVSMKNATDNANDLIKDLTLEYNKLRQGNITKELLEIAGGQAQ